MASRVTRSFLPPRIRKNRAGLNFLWQGQKSTSPSLARSLEREKEVREEGEGLRDRATEEPGKATSETELKHWCSPPRLVLSSPLHPSPPPFPLDFPGRLLRVYTHLGTHLRGHTATKVKLRRLHSSPPPLCVSLAYIIQLPVRLTRPNKRIPVRFYDYPTLSSFLFPSLFFSFSSPPLPPTSFPFFSILIVVSSYVHF